MGYTRKRYPTDEKSLPPELGLDKLDKRDANHQEGIL
jgi:hypothetical protein